MSASRDRAARQLDFSRRRVAAISFLANITTDDEPTEIRLDCLQGTHVLKEFRKAKRKRVSSKPADRLVVDEFLEKDDEDKIGDVKIARKLTFSGKEPDALDNDLAPSINGGASKTLSGEVQRQDNSAGQANLLHIDVNSAAAPKTNDQATRIGPVSAPPMSSQNKSSFNFHERPSTSHEHLGSGDGPKVGRRNVNPMKAANSGMLCGSSSESLTAVQALGARLRKISGTLSENSTTSLREIRYSRGNEEKSIMEERIVLVTPENKLPFAMFSSLPFIVKKINNRGDRELTKRHRHNSGPRPLSAITDGVDPIDVIGTEKAEDGQETSYSHLLQPTSTLEVSDTGEPPYLAHKRIGKVASSDGSSPSDMDEGDVYNPHDLDGWLIAGKHRTFLPFQSYVTSIIEYAKPSEMKRELNEKFKEKFPHIQITLSKLRSLKREMRNIAVQECKLDLLTVALSYVYFEKLVQKNSVSKSNRKFCAGACLILAAKLNDIKGPALTNLIEKVDSSFRLNRRDLLLTEFAVLVTLEFALHVPTWQVYPHYQRLHYEV